jgi:hypothetical protein
MYVLVWCWFCNKNFFKCLRVYNFYFKSLCFQRTLYSGCKQVVKSEVHFSLNLFSAIFLLRSHCAVSYTQWHSNNVKTQDSNVNCPKGRASTHQLPQGTLLCRKEDVTVRIISFLLYFTLLKLLSWSHSLCRPIQWYGMNSNVQYITAETIERIIYATTWTTANGWLIPYLNPKPTKTKFLGFSMQPYAQYFIQLLRNKNFVSSFYCRVKHNNLRQSPTQGNPFPCASSSKRYYSLPPFYLFYSNRFLQYETRNHPFTIPSHTYKDEINFLLIRRLSI